MSTHTMIKRLQAEIEKVNGEIDMRIMRGLSYKALSRQHKALVSELRMLERSSSKGFFGKIAEYASVFLM